MLKCKDCKYWVEAEGFERSDDIGGCTFNNNDGTLRYYPTFLNDDCNLRPEYLEKVMEQNG